jgi:hypothetical protein
MLTVEYQKVFKAILLEIIKKSSRSGRYRKVLIAPEELLPFAAKLEVVFKVLDDKRKQNEINDATLLSFGLLALLACRRNDAFQKKPISINQTDSLSVYGGRFSLSDFFALLQKNNLPITAFKKWLDKKTTLLFFLQHNRFRGIPDSARQALLEWLGQKYPLTLLFHIPTVDEVFTLQKQGGRCVTFFLNTNDLCKLHHERDAISFIIHDLIHAHEFYADPKRAVQQIGFYHWLDNIASNPKLQALIKQSPSFQERWEYVLSDMNSYCGHLLKTLHAAFVLHAKPGESTILWQNIVQSSNLTTEEKILFLKINTPSWQDEDFYQLEKIFENIRRS